MVAQLCSQTFEPRVSNSALDGSHFTVTKMYWSSRKGRHKRDTTIIYQRLHPCATFQQQIDEQFTHERMIARLTMLFGALALLLAALGLYGVTAYTVVRRTPEIGIRMALGAERSLVVAMVLRGAMLQAAFGLLIGVPLAMWSVRYVKSQLYGITNVNFTVMAAAIATLAVAAAIAGVIPAKRATSINPVDALRIE